MRLVLKPDPTDKTPNHFIVLCDGIQVGRIFDRVPGASAPRNATRDARTNHGDEIGWA
jgi:hypothetical protein